ncbi:GNAT family N-acetyltransferase [Pseudomonas aegrilactucae]|uniref:GNAT family N-acetyltransferase n=1 Tax=Pseudomonas aegrilactucae TaxID=2854028 RepID=A0A9Q2XMZ5_9PSED|nr:GNAT family N-acetyltransferase [Pseudomonas aegrilactucae]MBV6289853.1 GNAT family N-acetyltransferase [Pseudomonas aegrilactucae]
MLKIQRATPDDGAIAFDIRRQAIRQQCIGAYTSEQMLAWTAGSADNGYGALMHGHFFLGYIDGQPVTTGMLDVEAREVGAIFVLPAFMQRGYGTQMLAYLENLARSLGLQDVTLDATLNAAAFYRHCGYAGEQTSIYHSPLGIELACIPMVKTL